MKSTHPRTTSPLVVVTPPPTPNGRLHIGHVAGPYLRADLYTKLVRHVGNRPVRHVSHIDTYQSYVPKKARQLGLDVTDFKNSTQAGIVEDFASFGIEHDFFADNESEEYLKFLDAGVAHSLNYLDTRECNGKKCSGCDASLYESNLKGYCSNCFHDCFQNVCENCCIPHDYNSMLRPVCDSCGADRYYVDSNFAGRALHVSNEDILDVRNLMAEKIHGNRRLAALFGNMKPHQLALNHGGSYGFSAESLCGVINPWVEIYFAHLYSVMKVCGIDTSNDFARCVDEFNSLDIGPEVVCFFGVDNSYYYSFLYPLISLRLGIAAMIPVAVKASYFMLLNDAKISSSRNNVIWAQELLDERPLNVLRANLAYNCPEFAPKNYQHDRAKKLPSADGSIVCVDCNEDTIEFDVIQNKLRKLIEPREFSVEALLDIFDKYDLYERRMSVVENAGYQSSTRVALRELAKQLSLA